MPQKIPCQVTAVIDHGSRTYSLQLQPDRPLPRFLAGQFLHLALDEYRPGDFWPDSRSFSIASPPSERQLLRITYAVKGSFTGRMESEIHPGSRVWIKLPYGEFILDEVGEACLLAGGTGVTAFTAFLTDLQESHRRKVDLFYGAKLPSLLIYRPILENAQAHCPALSVHYFAEQGAEGTDCTPGRIEIDRVLELLADPLDLPYYLSGPPEMIKALQQGLVERGVGSGRILKDAWE